MGKHRSGHSYQEFPILNVARRCGLVLNDRTLEWEECGSLLPILRRPWARKDPSLSQHHQKCLPLCALRRKGQQRVPLRQDGGPFKPAGVSGVIGGQRSLPFPQQPLSQKPAEREPKLLAVRHNVYYDMLMHLELSPSTKPIFWLRD